MFLNRKTRHSQDVNFHQIVFRIYKELSDSTVKRTIQSEKRQRAGRDLSPKRIYDGKYTHEKMFNITSH